MEGSRIKRKREDAVLNPCIQMFENEFLFVVSWASRVYSFKDSNFLQISITKYLKTSTNSNTLKMY